MKSRIAAESAFQIGLFLGIVTIGFAVSTILARAEVPGARLIGTAVTITLIFTILLKWERFFNRFWPRAKR
ncbi:hypothetical protein OK349_02590 [Sphingomonas sp. BT-65]|uniref:hypothetical protein n=1 Tax=Sphingomonas sp. BT-65 TaxID=2989821 RepID=UPI00223692F8|nr:hypothetical protein [Sphingomonas sp. BT-65]MCW4460579.1 hypothetical protein [Sphingomonas sp. BT-65]